MDRITIHVAALMLIAASSAGAAAEVAYPKKAVRLIVGLPPGSQPDTVARAIGHGFTENLGQQVIIDNVSGAAGNIATERLIKAAPDGYTLGLLTQGQLVVNPSLYRLTFDTTRDLAPVSQVSTSPTILVVHNAVPAKNVPELIKLARAAPGELAFASGGSGSSPHIAAELLKVTAGLDIRHVPYKGVAAATPDLIAGRVPMMFAPASLALPLVRDGKLRALAVSSAKRFWAAPELPTVAESGVPAFQFTTWNGVLAPVNTPAAVIKAVHTETARVLASPDVRARFAELGLEPIGHSPDEFAAVIKHESSRWARLVRDAGIKAD